MTDAPGVTAAAGSPFPLDGSVNKEKLVELLDVQTELAWLDYKRECDLSHAEGLVELAKDVGAMGILGGYLAVGADDAGTAVGLPAGQAGSRSSAAAGSEADRANRVGSPTIVGRPRLHSAGVAWPD
jgi:hypothetical protein